MASYFKDLQKKLPKMDQAQREVEQFRLDKMLERERNPMVRASLKDRLRLVNRTLKRVYPGQSFIES